MPTTAAVAHAAHDSAAPLPDDRSAPSVADRSDPVAATWSPLRRIGFRWLFAYVVLYMLQPSPLDFIAPGLVAPYSALWESVVKWVGRHLLGLDITVLPNASGDTTYNWVQVLCYAMLAALVAGVWTLVDRRARDHRRLHDWLRAAVRVYLSIFMFLYGSAKVIKVQFPDLSPATLHLPLGDFSPNTLLWTFMGASTLYTFWSGLLEMVGGLLLISRRTTLLGALVCIGVMSNVVMLNLSYDVVVKLFSLHLLAVAVILAAPDARRLLDFFVRNRAVPAAELRPLATSPRRHRLVLAARTAGLVAIALFFLAYSDGRRQAMAARGPGAKVQGSWVVQDFAVDAGPPATTRAAASWRRLVLDSRQRALVQLDDGQWRRYHWQMVGRGIELSDSVDAPAAVKLEVGHPEPGRLELAGEVDSRRVRAVLAREEPRFRLLDNRIRWIRDGPVR